MSTRSKAHFNYKNIMFGILFIPIEASTCFKLAASPLMNARNRKSTVILEVLKIAYSMNKINISWQSRDKPRVVY